MESIYSALEASFGRLEQHVERVSAALLEKRYYQRLDWLHEWIRKAAPLAIEDLPGADALGREDERALADTSILARGCSPGGDPLFAAVEVALRIEPEDVSNAKRAALILGRAGLNAIGIVGGYEISPEARSAASLAGVAVHLTEPAR